MSAPHPRFGTDGVRGRAIDEITPEFCLSLGRAAARVLRADRVVIGRDPRESGPVLQAALASGLAAEGVDVDDLGIVPTPAVAMFAARDGVPGVVVTASHNPFHDNGVKIFGAGGTKLTDAQQEAIEAELESILNAEPSGSIPRRVGVVTRRPLAVADYVDRVVAHFGEGSLAGLRIVLDTANGAMSDAAPETFRRLGADVIVLNDAPDGVNINLECGATSTAGLCSFVATMGTADAGFAFDGDGDRVIAVDGTGRVVDGDRLIALSALDRKERGRLTGGAVVTTVMANLGFHRAMEAAGVQVIVTPVGDRHVLDAMVDGGFVLGGEQSGHIIHRDIATTGDGLVSAVAVAEMVVRTSRALAESANAVMTSFPQVLRNVPVARRPSDVATEMRDEIAAVEGELGADGRVLVRSSGTEPLVRVMVEAPTLAAAEAAAERLCAAASRRFA
ncbi:MAG: phosphoglucosamine mutase [Ilumatobacteraceae bacterium]